MRRPRLQQPAPQKRSRGGAATRRTLALLGSILALLALIVGLNEPRPHPLQDRVVPAGPISTVPYTLTVGIYATNNHALNLAQPSFIGEGYLWMRWGPELEKLLE